MKIPGFGGGAANAGKVDLPPANAMGKADGLAGARPDMAAANGKNGNSPLSFGNVLNVASGAGSLLPFGKSGGNDSVSGTQGNGGSQSLSGEGGGIANLAKQLLMLLGLQQLLGGNNGTQNQAQNQGQAPQSAQQPAQTQQSGQSNNPLEQLMKMIQEAIQKMLGISGEGNAVNNTPAGQGAASGARAAGGNAGSPVNGAGSEGGGQQAGGLGGMLKNALMMLGLNALMQMITGGGQGQSQGTSQNQTHI